MKEGPMTKDDLSTECSDPEKKSMTIELPCEMVVRVQKLARENNTSLSNILIEALDSFLRRSGR